MKKIDRDYLNKLASDMMFNLSEESLNKIELKSENFMYYLELLNKVNTDNVEEMSYPFELENDWLRDDVVSHTITREEAFVNAPKTKGEYFEVVQVIDK